MTYPSPCKAERWLTQCTPFPIGQSSDLPLSLSDRAVTYTPFTVRQTCDLPLSLRDSVLTYPFPWERARWRTASVGLVQRCWKSTFYHKRSPASDICALPEYNCSRKSCVLCTCEIFVYDMHVCSGPTGTTLRTVSRTRAPLSGGFPGGILSLCRIRWNTGPSSSYSSASPSGHWSRSFPVGCSAEPVSVHTSGYIGSKPSTGCNTHTKSYFPGYWLIRLVEWLNSRLSSGFLCVCSFSAKSLKKIMKWFQIFHWAGSQIFSPNDRLK